MADITGNIYTVDTQQYSSMWGSNVRIGSILSVDASDGYFSKGIQISDSTARPDISLSFTQHALIDPSGGLGLTFQDRTYVDGSMNPDGTIVDSTLLQRYYNPLWVNYSVWIMTPPMLVGTPQRTPLNPSVGQYEVNMFAPDVPGEYQLRWRYQKDQSSHAKELAIPFYSASGGVSPFVTYEDTFGGGSYGEGGFGD